MTYSEWRRRRSCEDKATYFCERCANHAVLRLMAQGRPARTYECEHCGLLHVTTREEAA